MTQRVQEIRATIDRYANDLEALHPDGTVQELRRLIPTIRELVGAGNIDKAERWLSYIDGALSMHRQNARPSMAGALRTIRDLGWTPGAILDVGVAMGTAGLYSVWPGVPIALVDPNPANRPYMEQIAAKYPRVSIWNVGASETSGTMHGRACTPTGQVTLGKSADGKAEWEDGDFPVMTCDAIVQQSGLNGPFLLKIDTDSHEREILRGARQMLAETEVCVIELSMYNHLKHKAAAVDLVADLTGAGFALMDVVDGRYMASGVLRLCDAVFAKASGDVMRRAYAASQKRNKIEARRTERQRALVGDNPHV